MRWSPSLFPRVILLKLSSCMLEINKLGNLTQLSILNLMSNVLEGEIPVELGKLTSVHWLNPASNRLLGPIPREELGNLVNATEVLLGYNRLSGYIPAELGKLANLDWLYLGPNLRLTEYSFRHMRL